MATKEQHKRYQEKYPWINSYNALTQRCNNPNSYGYQWYGAKGIKTYLNKEDVKFFWFRDKAYLMKKPSIDRENNKGNYTLKNSRFIEGNINYSKDKFIKIAQYDLKDRLIKIWDSQKEVSEKLNIHQTYISKVINSKLKSTCGFIFKKA